MRRLFSSIYSTNARAVSGQISFTAINSSSVREMIVFSILSFRVEAIAATEESASRDSGTDPFDFIHFVRSAQDDNTTFAICFAVFFPTFGIPSATNTRSSVVFRAFSIDSRRLFTDFSLYHSSEKNSSR